MKFCPPTYEPVWLASHSPRRRSMLVRAGVDVSIRPAGVDDGQLVRGQVEPDSWVMALAYFKARWVTEVLAKEDACERGTILGADTLCVHEGHVLGQPVDAEEARAMLHAMRDDTHVTMTGVCLISRADGRRWLFVDCTVVRIGRVGDEVIDEYIDAGQWRGKAGAYNLHDRIADGWPIECDGDPDTVMGLPMRRLEPWLEQVRRGRR